MGLNCEKSWKYLIVHRLMEIRVVFSRCTNLKLRRKFSLIILCYFENDTLIGMIIRSFEVIFTLWPRKTFFWCVIIRTHKLGSFFRTVTTLKNHFFVDRTPKTTLFINLYALWKDAFYHDYAMMSTFYFTMISYLFSPFAFFRI